MDFWIATTVYPVFSPLTLESARNQLRIDSSDTSHDGNLNRYIDAAAERWERETDRTLSKRTRKMIAMDVDRPVELPGGRLLSLDLVESRESNSDEWAVNTAYESYDLRTPPQIVFDPVPSQVRITYTSGFESTNDIPADYRLALLQLVAHYFENAGDVQMDLPAGLKSLMRSQHAGTVAGYWNHQPLPTSV